MVPPAAILLAVLSALAAAVCPAFAGSCLQDTSESTAAVGVHPAFDAYGRLVRHAWLDGDLTKGSGSGAGYPTKPPLVELVQAYNLADFITERFDDRPGSARNRDQQYDNDMLLRLVEATRGEMAGSTFTVKPGSERYGYDFVGNFVEFDTDRTGDGDFTDGADQTIAGTFSMVNEVEEIVVTEGGSSPDYLFEHDAAGNLSSREISSNRWIKAVHDAWGRLTKVDLKVGESTYPRARVEYNGLNMRTLVDRDADTSDGTHALTERRLVYYSSGWQVLEEHVDTDTPLNRDSASDVDRVVQTVWGPRYIDDLILRRQNNNHAGGGDTDFSDGGVDRPGDWALTDPQFSVIALIDDAATIVERVSYDAYGQARHHRAKDVDGDGDVDSTDGSIVHAARGKSIHQSGYNADADWDRDGDVDTTDEAAFGSGHWQSAIALGQVSAVDNALGFCAYVFNPETGWYTVRFRHYDPTTGVARWLERDPAGYVDGPSLYGYGRDEPQKAVDPFGLFPPDSIMDQRARPGMDDAIEAADYTRRILKATGQTGQWWPELYTLVGVMTGLQSMVDGVNGFYADQQTMVVSLSGGRRAALIITGGVSFITTVAPPALGGIRLIGVTGMRRLPSHLHIHAGSQGKHIVGHNNFVVGRSVLTANADELLQTPGKVQVLPGGKYRVDWGKHIGWHVDERMASPTSVGVVHVRHNGDCHIVPARPRGEAP